ncbi:MAG: hypothetical protein ACYS0H_21415 [Planctomycetota bacterium]|jgi:hypothetical protein
MSERKNAMANFPQAKWYAEKLYELLLQDPDCMTTAELARELGIFLTDHRIRPIEAQAPPGVTDDAEG